MIRYAMIPPGAYAIWVIFATASRGAVVALIASFLFVVFRAPARQRVVALAVGFDNGCRDSRFAPRQRRESGSRRWSEVNTKRPKNQGRCAAIC